MCTDSVHARSPHMFEFERAYYVNVVGDNAICILYIKRPLYRNQTKAIRFYGVSVAQCAALYSCGARKVRQ